MNTPAKQFTHARRLLAEINAAPGVYVPRRDVIVDWLASFMKRTQLPRFVLGETEEADLVALEHFLREQQVVAL